jgi:hypothetical protein
MRRKFFDLIWVWSEGGGGRLRIACIDSLFTGYRVDVLYWSRGFPAGGIGSSSQSTTKITARINTN